MKAISAWTLMEQGKFELAYAQMTAEMSRNPESTLRHIYNRGLCLFHLNRPAEALGDFQTLSRLRSDSDSGYIGMGIALWWLGRQLESTDTWRSSINKKYTDAAGGVEILALLYFAASHLLDPAIEKEAISLLKRKTRSKRIDAWPGPIVGFLLGKVDENTFLQSKKKDDPSWESRRLTKANFWIGLSYFRQGNIKNYMHHLRKTLSGNIIEPEYYLAKYELERLDSTKAI